MNAPLSDAFVFFGATGDLAYKQIFPALQSMVRRDNFAMPIVGVAKAGWNLDQLKERARKSLEEHGGVDGPAFEKLCSLLRYVDGDYKEPATFQQLKKVLEGAKRPLHYLAIPPSMFATVAEGLAKAGCAKDARVILEKPFGRDLKSAVELNRILHQTFPEESIFRIDHYLGKEPVQNLVYFRAGNPVVESNWDRSHIESVEITMAESFGVQGRGKFYEETGAIRDVLQNHMLEVVACLAMELPKGAHDNAIRQARGDVLGQIRPLTPDAVVRGQFRGYRDEPGVAKDSDVETFAAVRLTIDSERWRDVPFFVRVGKKLPVTVTEVLVRFKGLTQPVLDESHVPPANYCRFRLGPHVVIALAANVKKPGEKMVGEGVELVVHHQRPDEMQPYERLLGDAIKGDTALFARQDAVEASWRVVDPVLGKVVPLKTYEPHTWGPEGTDRIVAPRGGWHDPEADDVMAAKARASKP